MVQLPRFIKAFCLGFIDYLNKYKFPNEKSAAVKNLGWTGLGEELSEEFRELPYFNF